MNEQQMIDDCKRYTMYTWTAGGAVNPLPVERADGIYFYTPSGKRYIDFNSQLMSVHIGHNDARVKDALRAQLDQLQFIYPGTATAPRARLGKLLSEVVPGDINTFFFTLGGAEANENAIRAARTYTGRAKIITRYRSYHGATNAAMQLTGDPRRWPNEPGMPGIIRVMDPWPYNYSFGDDEDEITRNNLTYLEEVIMYEGPHTIAAMFIESVTGTNGILAPPRGYLKGLKALLEKYGILLVCDEVMSGFGRTGKMFGFQHGDIVPDIVTMAKGLTGSYLPLGAMGVSDPIAAHFRDNVFPGGLTYNSHPLCLSVAEAVVKIIIEDGLVDNAARLESVMRQEMDQLKDKHPCVKTSRCIGLFGIVDLQKNSAGEPMAPYNGTSEAMAALGKAFGELGLFTFVRWSSFMCNPPLIINESQLREAYAVVDKALDAVDPFFEG